MIDELNCHFNLLADQVLLWQQSSVLGVPHYDKISMEIRARSVSASIVLDLIKESA